MSTLNVSAAARATGIHRVTIQKHIKQGKLSAIRDEAGKPQIDVAELIRVYGPLKSDGSTGSAAQSVAEQQQTTSGGIVAETALEALREQLKAAQEREEWLKRQLEAEQERSRELERRMLPPGGEKKGFFARLFGR